MSALENVHSANEDKPAANCMIATMLKIFGVFAFHSLRWSWISSIGVVVNCGWKLLPTFFQNIMSNLKFDWIKKWTSQTSLHKLQWLNTCIQLCFSCPIKGELWLTEHQLFCHLMCYVMHLWQSCLTQQSKRV